MTKTLHTKIKLLLPISILIIIFLELTITLVSKQYTKSKLLDELENSVLLATHISKLLHETQKERGMSSGYLASSGEKFKSKLLSQRLLTDKRFQELVLFLPTIKEDKIKIDLEKTLLYIKELKVQRDKIDSLNITTEESIKFYSNTNDKFLYLIVKIAKISEKQNIMHNLMSYSNFLYAKENAGIERAVGMAILSQNKFLAKQRVQFTNLIAIQKLYLKNFLEYASDETKSYYEKNHQGKEIGVVETIRETILHKNSEFNIDSKYWFENITLKINKLKLVDDYIEQEIISNIKKELDSTYRNFGAFTLLNIISTIIFVIMIILVVKLIKSEKRLKNLTDKYIISSTTDLKGKITEVSEAFCEISGYTREELVGKAHNIIRHPDMPKSAFKDLWETIEKGETWQGKIKNLKKDGGYYWVYANIEPLFDKKGDVEAYVAVRLDITDSIQLKEELEIGRKKDETLLHQSKLAQMGEMISMIAHQWRQPLSAISSTSSDMQMKILLDNYNKDYFTQKLEKINEFSKHLSKTIDDFRGFYKKDKEKVEMKFSTIAEGALTIISASMENQNIKLTTDFACKKKIYSYPNEIRQVILNLIKNAEDALIEKNIQNPQIDIKTYDHEDYSYFEVSDNAGGISEDILYKIFDPYFSTKMQKDGTGLGLYMSKTIIEDHCAGKLLTSNSDNGALFTIKIPLAKEI